MVIPVALFAYARPELLARVLECLRVNEVPLIYAFADAAKGDGDAARVAEVRSLLRSIDWCEVRLTERTQNLGLGRSILTGVGNVASQHEAFIVWEDDLICVPGTYEWMGAALRQYAKVERVMSVSAWTHPRVTPADITTSPYFDGRGDCWVWGGYARSWRGMAEQTAMEKLAVAAGRGCPVDAYGSDLLAMAKVETQKNIWAVRWLSHHLAQQGLCLRPPWSMVEHIGFDANATNAGAATDWANPPLRPVPPIPARWPELQEHADCRRLWAAANPGGWRRLLRRIRARIARIT